MTEFIQPDLEKVKRLQSRFPRELREVDLLPLDEHDPDLFERVKMKIPYLVLAYAGGIIEKYLPSPISWLGSVFKKIAEKVYGVKQRDVF